jgi:hypothetical protein
VNPKTVTPRTVPRPIRIGSPLSGAVGAAEIFDASVQGTIAPPVTDLNSVWINVTFSSATSTANGGTDTALPPFHPSSATVWSCLFTPAQLPKMAVTDGVLVVTKTAATDGTVLGTDKSEYLSWTPPSHEEAHPVQLKFIQPVPNDVVGRVFLVYGEYPSGHGHTVSLELIRGDTGDPALATVLPMVNPAPHKWVTAVYVFESGSNYDLQAKLRRSTGEVISSRTVPNITILG